MKKYRGYYIDGIHFCNKKEIDEFIKKQSIDHYKKLAKLFENNPTMELTVMMSKQGENLVNQFGLTWDEIEELEVAAWTA